MARFYALFNSSSLIFLIRASACRHEGEGVFVCPLASCRFERTKLSANSPIPETVKVDLSSASKIPIGVLGAALLGNAAEAHRKVGFRKLVSGLFLFRIRRDPQGHQSPKRSTCSALEHLISRPEPSSAKKLTYTTHQLVYDPWLSCTAQTSNNSDRCLYSTT